MLVLHVRIIVIFLVICLRLRVSQKVQKKINKRSLKEKYELNVFLLTTQTSGVAK